VTESAPAPSYRALLAVPSLARILLATQIARIGQSMVGIALVLFTLAEFGSPVLAGFVTFASIFPGLLASPIAGALLDRHGRVRLVILDYVVALSALVLLAVLSLAGLLEPPMLLLIAMVSSLTAILSHTGLRSLFPIIVPPHLWERVNALDSNGYIIASILGPPIAAALVALAGGPVALLVGGCAFGLAALIMIGMPDPATRVVSSGRLLVDAWLGVRYAWGNRTIRGLGFSVSVINIGWGMMTIVVPLIVLRRLGYPETVVGLVFALSGVTGMLSAFVVGRIDSRGREWRMLVGSMLLLTPVIALLLPASDPALVVAGITLGAAGCLAILVVAFALFGLLQGPLDIALFTIRQRRTDPAWMGRAFAVSMAFNYVGIPIGAALGGSLAAASPEAAIGLGVATSIAGAVLAAVMIPRSVPAEPQSPAERLPAAS
jgi:MFS family permease